MFSAQIQFAETASGGISSLGINLKGFLFQLITFLIVMLLLKRYAFPKLVATLEARRATLQESLVQARATQEALANAQLKAEELLAQARAQADQSLADAKVQADKLVAVGELKSAERAARIIKEAEDRLGKEREKLHSQLKSELAELVAVATEKVLRKKITAKEDRQLIEESLKELA